MPPYVLDGAPVEAFGHPGACSEPADGTVEDTTPITYNGTPIATQRSGTLSLPRHGHDTTAEGSCTQYESHDVMPTTVSSSVSYNGYGLCIVTDGAGTDPGSGGDIDITGAGGNSAVTETP